LLSAVFRILALARKDLAAMLKDPNERGVLFVPPVIIIILFGYVATFDLNRINYVVLNRDRSPTSFALLATLDSSNVFRRVANLERPDEVRDAIDDRRALLAVEIDADFERHLEAGESADLQVIVDGRNSNTAGTALNYMSAIVDSFNADWRRTHGEADQPVTIALRAWYNPNLESRWSVVSALVGAATIAEILLLTAMSVAREKEQGTFDQLLVTPFRPFEIVAGKALPPFMVGLIHSVTILIVALFWYRIPFEGSFAVLYIGIVAFFLAVVGAGLLLSSILETMQQALLVCFLVAMPLLLLSGLFTPLNSMPRELQYLTLIDPARYMIDIARKVYLEGSGLNQIWPDLWPLLVMAAVTLTLGASVLRQRLG
jgi:pyoluteorin transport system permease protein